MNGRGDAPERGVVAPVSEPECIVLAKVRNCSNWKEGTVNSPVYANEDDEQQKEKTGISSSGKKKWWRRGI